MTSPVLQMFREMKNAGNSLLISTHMLDSVEDFWDVAHIMVDGRFAATKFNTAEGSGDKTLEELFFEITEGKVVGKIQVRQVNPASAHAVLLEGTARRGNTLATR